MKDLLASNHKGIVVTSNDPYQCKVTVVFEYKEAMQIMRILDSRYDIKHTLSFPVNFENILRNALKEVCDKETGKI